MKSYHYLLFPLALTIPCGALGYFEKTDWNLGNGLRCIETPAPDISVKLPDYKPSGDTYKINVGKLKVLISMSKAPVPKEEWKITSTTYRVMGTGADFGETGFPITEEQNGPEFKVGFDYKPELKGQTKTGTLCGQVKVAGYKYIIKNNKEIKLAEDQDTGISGKDTSATISITY